MLDSSPIPISPPKKLKRTASAASLPSPPPSVEHCKKRTASQRLGTDTDSGGEVEADEATKDPKVVGRKLLFPVAPSTSGVDDADSPRMDNNHTSSIVAEQLYLDAEHSPSAHRSSRPTSPLPSERKATTTLSPSPWTPSLIDNRGRRSTLELPVLDEEDNPFLVNGPPKPRRPRSACDFTEQPTMTYVLYVHNLLRIMFAA